METIQLKTNIKCSGCVAAVTPFLNEAVGANNWKVDIQSPDKTITVEAGNVNKNDVVEAIEKAGYTAQEK